MLTSGGVNGVNCQPMNGAWSGQNYGCVTTQPCSYYSGYSCNPYQGGYGSIYYYTNGAPSYNPYQYGYTNGGYGSYGHGWAWTGFSWTWY